MTTKTKDPKSEAPTERPEQKTSKFALKKKKVKFSEEIAMPKLLMLLERYDIDIEAEKDSKEKEAFEKELDQILKYIMHGKIDIEMLAGELIVTQYLDHTSEKSTIPDNKIVYGELTGAIQDTVPPGKDANQVAIVNHVMGLACKHIAGPEWVRALKSSDKKVLFSMGSLFLSH